jgi:glycosyltransferase involved in cell wall biosynthesis
VIKLSIVSPCFNERRSLRPLYNEIVVAFDGAAIDWEWILVDDHSSDGTFDEILEMSQIDSRVRGIRLARNAGSHVAMFCGLDHATGDCAAVLMADLQDPPSVLVELLEKWHEGYKVVWAAQVKRRSAGWFYNALARAYYFTLRRVVNIRQIPKNGADFFLIDRAALEIVRAHRDRNISIFSLVGWLDLRNAIVPFDKQPRRFGASKWSFARRVKLFIDTITGFSHFPIRSISIVGALCSGAGFLYAIYALVQYLFGNIQPGWTSIVVLVLVLGGLQIVMIGVLGEYFARMLDEVRPRPRYIIERISPELGGPPYDDALVLTPSELPGPRRSRGANPQSSARLGNSASSNHAGR